MLGARTPGLDLLATDGLDDRGEVGGRRTAAAADQRQAELLDELGVRGGELLGRERVGRALLGEHRQAGVGHAGDGDAGVAREVAQVLAHLGRAGGAVEPDRVDAQRLQRRQRRTDLRAHEHRARGLDRHLDHDREVLAGVGQRTPRADDGGLGLQQVLRGLDEDGVHPAVDHAAGLFGVRVAQQGERRVPQRGQLGARTDRTDDEPRLLGRGPRRGGLGRDPGACVGQLVDPVGDVVLAEVGVVGAEGVGLDAVDAHLEVGVVDAADDVRPGDVEDLVAALVALEVVHRGVGRLEHRAHRAVGDEDTLGERGAEEVGAAAQCGGPSRRGIGPESIGGVDGGPTGIP